MGFNLATMRILKFSEEVTSCSLREQEVESVETKMSEKKCSLEIFKCPLWDLCEKLTAFG